MAIRLILNVDAVDDLRAPSAYGTAAAAVVESASSESGTYAAFATAVLAPGTSQYEVWDPNGTDASWYRYRISGNLLFSDYSDPFRASALAAYATLDDLLERLNLPDETRYNLLSDILEAVSAQLDVETGRRFYRDPQVSGTAVRYYDGEGTDRIVEPDGIVSVDQVEVRDGTDGPWSTLEAASWTLRPLRPEPYRPYSELVLVDTAKDWTYFPVGYGTVRVTGVFGYAAVPPLVREAVVELAARVYNESQTNHAGVVGLPEVGGASLMPMNRPDAWHRAVRLFGRRAGLAV